MTPGDATPRLTVPQAQAVESPSPMLAVVASAGAGKTTVLAERYVRLVQDGVAPSQILTVTFTRKAAGEMKRRIVRRLRDRGMTEAAQAAETGPIQTLHSLCERLVRENALHLGIDPDFELLDEAGTTERMADSIRRCLLPADADPRLARLLQAMSKPQYSPFGALQRATDGDVRDRMERLVKAMRSGVYTRDDLAQWVADPDAFDRAWAQVMAPLLPGFELTPGVPLSEALHAYRREHKNSGPAWLIGKGTVAEMDHIEAETARQLLTLVLQIWETFESGLAELGWLDLTLIERLTVRLLTELPAARKRVNRQFAVVLVDEVQDVNPVQYALLNQLAEGRRFAVGDPQQSIYGFRYAAPHLFEQEIAERESIRLADNFRSSPPTLAFVNHLFSFIWGERYAAMSPGLPAPSHAEPVIEHWMKPSRGATQDVCRNIAALVSEGIPLADIAVLCKVTRTTEKILSGLRRLGIPAMIESQDQRLFTRLEILDAMHLLAALHNPQDDFAMAALLLSPLVGLRLDDVATWRGEPGGLYAALRAQGLPEPHTEREQAAWTRFLNWFPPLAAIADRTSGFDVLHEALHQANGWSAYAQRPDGEQSLANLRKILRLAASAPHKSAGELARWLRESPALMVKVVEGQRYDDSDAYVRILTAHASKGLEFPVVVIPDLEDYKIRSSDEVVADGLLGLVAVRAEPRGWRHAFLDWLRRDREEAELKRLFYVACTRAEQRLCIASPPSDSRTPRTLGLFEASLPSSPVPVRVRRPEGE